MPGGHSAPSVPGAEESVQLQGFKEIVEEKAGGANYEMFLPVTFTRQVVAGMVYQVKYQVGEAEFVHAKVFVALPHTGNPPVAMAVQSDQTEDDAFAF